VIASVNQERPASNGGLFLFVLRSYLEVITWSIIQLIVNHQRKKDSSLKFQLSDKNEE